MNAKRAARQNTLSLPGAHGYDGVLQLLMPVPAKPVYAFGAFRYDAQQRLLFRDGKLIPLVPKATDTLHVLIENHGRIMEKGELMRLIWPDAVVEEVGLARNISLVRKALGDDTESDRHIETISRRGYRFVAEVRVQNEVFPQRKPERHIRRKLIITISVVWILAGLIYWQFYRPSRYLHGSG